MSDLESYFDQHGLLSDQSPARTVENNVLWHITYFMLCREHSPILQQIDSPVIPSILRCRDKDGQWHVSPDHSIMPEEGFSRDNMIAVVSLGLLLNNKELAEAGWKSMNTKYLQPQDFIYFAYAAGKWWAKPLLSIALVNMLFSAASHKKCGLGILDTDGRVLTFLRAIAIFSGRRSLWGKLYCRLVFKILKSRLQSYLKANPSETPWFAADPDTNQPDPNVNPWRTIFAMYFKDPSHPINLVAAEIYP